MKNLVKYSAIILCSSLLGCVALNTDYNIGSQQPNIVYAAKKKTSLNSNKSIEKYLKKQNKSLKILEVNGTYAEKGNYTTQITLDAKDNGMNNAKNQVIMAVKALNKRALRISLTLALVLKPI
ncbi:hypothetical protein AUF15_08420 [Enterococcus avium]|uniref:hypothetical protein n=1 Tax=Enterococcus avium TaxID=33945 RepID=UPI0011867CC1|nr:hypothetical protein [Enterococcus avium]TRZ30941.1 hypothetical protein AUF15_08420 [Enterococcus avium]